MSRICVIAMYIFHTCVFILLYVSLDHHTYHVYACIYNIYICMCIYIHIFLYVLYCTRMELFPYWSHPCHHAVRRQWKFAAAAKTKPVPSAAIDTGDGGSGATEDWAATASPCSKLMHYAIRDGPSESAYISISHEHRMWNHVTLNPRYLWEPGFIEAVMSISNRYGTYVFLHLINV